VIAGARRKYVSIFFGKDRGMAFFLAFLVLTTIILPILPLSQVGHLAVSLTFTVTLIVGASAIIRHRLAVFLVDGLTMSTFVVDWVGQFAPAHNFPVLDTTLKLVCLSILVFITLERTLRPGPVTGYRVIGGIAGYLLIGYAWSFGYQLLEQRIPGAIYFEPSLADSLSRPEGRLIYFSFVTLTTVGYGDVHPAHPTARSLAVAEALVGQLYLAILIASLVGMALQAKSAQDEPPRKEWNGRPGTNA
jgi:hypothetical protein